MNEASEIKPEFSYPVELSELPEEEASFEFSASKDELAALAGRFDLAGLDRLDAQLTLSWIKHGEALSVSGRLQADVVQSCVITLEPVHAHVDEAVDLVFAREIEANSSVIDPDEAEPLSGDWIDLGELVSEELSLALDPYPRSPDIDPSQIELGPGAGLSSDETETAENKGRHRPFEVLAGLKPKL